MDSGGVPTRSTSWRSSPSAEGQRQKRMSDVWEYVGMATFSAAIESYLLGAFSSWDAGLGWEVEQSRSALLVHDLLPYYLSVLDDGLVTVLLANTAALIDDARHHNIPVIASAPRPATSIDQRGLGGRLWGLGPSVTEASTPALEQLADPAVPWIAKRSLSAFYATDLEVELRRLGRDQLVIAGVFASGGVLATTFDALARDLQVFVVTDAVADYTQDLHANALTTIARSTGQAVATTVLRSAWQG